MAGGFIRGLVHGTAVSLVALAGLSLMAPGPARSPDRASADGDAASSVPGTDQPAKAVMEPGPIAVETGAAPAAPVEDDRDGRREAPGAVLDVPVGSEFGRAGDLPPRIPASVSGGGPAPEAPRPVPQPRSEPAPVAATGARDRPEAAADAAAPAQPGMALQDGGLGVSLPSPAPQDGPGSRDLAPSALPGPSEDRAPQLQSVMPPTVTTPGPNVPAAAPAAAPATGVTGEALSDEGGRGGVAIPRLHAPAIDLSLPPDLGDLRRLERN